METLLTLAEIAVGFAGFASIVVAFRRQSDSWQPTEVALYRTLLAGSLGACALALIPPVLSEFQPSIKVLWVTSSGTMLAYTLVRLLQTFVLGPNVPASKQVWGSGGGRYWVIAVGVLNVTLQVTNIAGVPLPTGPAAYVAGVALYLASAGVAFFRLLALSTGEPGAGEN